MPEPLLEARNLVQEFAVRGSGGAGRGVVHALSDVSLEVRDGEALGVVGETGSGKSTLARSILAAPKPKSGQVLFRGVDVLRLPRRELRKARQAMQMVFQDPAGSLDPKMRVFDLVEEPLIARGVDTKAQRRERVEEVLELVGLEPSVHGQRRPRQLSGGQCQRVAIARALTVSPALLVCDEAVSSLDVLIQAQVINLLEDLRRELGLSYLFIAHDLALVRHISDRVAVMYLGQLAEVGPSEAIYRDPLHPYTALLLASSPSADPTTGIAEAGDGELPSALDPPSGCRFRTRCPRAEARCAEERPLLRALEPDHSVACHFPLARL